MNLNAYRNLNWKLFYSLLGSVLLTQQAFGVAAYTPPCHNQEMSFSDSKETLSDCIDHIEQSSSGSSLPPSKDCSFELKDLNKKAIQLRDCKVDPSKAQSVKKSD